MKLAFVEGMALFAAALAALVPPRPCSADIALAGARAFVLSLAAAMTFYYYDLYDLRFVRTFARFVKRLPRSAVLAAVLLAGLGAIVPGAAIPHESFRSLLPALLVTLLLVRAAAYGLLGGRPFVERVLVLGSGRLAQAIVEEFEAQPRFRHLVLGVIEDGTNGDRLPRRCLRLGPLEHLNRIIADFGPDRIIVALGAGRARLPVQELLVPWAHGILVEDGAEVYEHLTGKLAIEAISPNRIVFSKDFRKPRVDLAVRRAMSLVVAAVGLVLTAPLFLLIAVLIELDSPGPVFFVQERLGAWGKPFRLIKFRTMRPASSPTSEWVRDNGKRITRIGSWLRKYRLDELPQFINVLRGDMDLVGPRPHPVSNYELLVLVTRNVPECGEKIPYYTLRSVVRPGITGWAQIRYGYANDVEEETEKIRYDLYYIKHRSLWLDLHILLDTIKIILFGRGSDRVVPENGTLIARAGWALADGRIGSVPGIKTERIIGRITSEQGDPDSISALIASRGSGPSSVAP